MKRAKTKSKMLDLQSVPKIEITYLGRDVVAAVANPYGLHSSPKKETECLLAFINGDDGNRVVIPLSNKNRKTLKETEVIVGNFEKKSTIFFDEKGNITLDCAKDITLTIKGNATINVTGDTKLTCPETTVNGNITVNGTIDATGKITSADDCISAGVSGKNHTHPVPSALKAGSIDPTIVATPNSQKPN